MKKLLLTIVVVFLTTLSMALSQGVKPQVPNEKVGLGVKVGSTGGNGISFTYAMKENIHIGSGLGLGLVTESSSGADDGGVLFNFNPFFRYIFENKMNFFPYLEFNFMFTQYPAFNQNVSSSGLNFQFGGMWFPFNTVSMRGGVTVITYDIDRSQLGIGALGPFIGIDWWL